MRQRFQALLNDNRGAVAVTAAMLIVVVCALAALGIDAGKAFADRRKAQSATDLAAIAAVSDLANADRAAAATLDRNHLAQGASYALEYGTYSANPSLAPAQRFQTASASLANAARVTVRTTTPLSFGRLLVGRDRLDIQTRAIAARTAFAGFAIGTRLLRVDGGLLNKIVGGLLGANLALTVMDYQALIDCQIDAFTFIDALSTRLSLTGPTYDQVLNASMTVGTVIDAMTDAAKASAGPTSVAARALGEIGQQVRGSTASIRIGSIVDVGPYRPLPLSQKPKAGLSAAALDMLTATAQIANGRHQIETALDLNIPGIVAATLKLAIGERPQGRSWITVGAEGASVHTAQTRLLVTAQVAGSGQAALVNLPIYLELASGTARLTALQCGFPNVAASSVRLGVTPSVIDAWIGDVSNAEFTNFTAAPNPPAAKLVDASLLKVTARAHVSVSNLSEQPVTFSYADIAQKTKKTVGAQDFTATLLSRLVGDAQLGVTVGGLNLGLGPSLTQLVAGILGNAVSPLDRLLSALLNTLGVGIGQADVWVPSLRCDGAVLVL